MKAKSRFRVLAGTVGKSWRTVGVDSVGCLPSQVQLARHMRTACREICCLCSVARDTDGGTASFMATVRLCSKDGLCLQKLGKQLAETLAAMRSLSELDKVPSRGRCNRFSNPQN